MKEKENTGEGIIFNELSCEILKKGHLLRFQARGNSMHPFIKDKDIIKIKPVEPLKLKAGDVIFYLSGSKRLIAHRLIKKTKGKEDELLFVTKGDSTHGFDEAIPSSSVLGKVVAVERDEKEISMETRVAGFKNFLLSKTSPFSFILYPLGRRVKKIGLAIFKK